VTSTQPNVFYKSLHNPYPRQKPKIKVYQPHYMNPKSIEKCHQRLVRRVGADVKDEFTKKLSRSTNMWKSCFPNFGILPNIGNLNNKAFPKMFNLNALPNKYTYTDYHTKNTNPGYSRDNKNGGRHFTS